MGSTSRFGIPFPEDSDQNDVPLDMEEAVSVIDAKAAIYLQGTYAARPPAGVAGRFYRATDIDVVFNDDGTQWKELTRGGPWLDWPIDKVSGSGWSIAASSANWARYKVVSGSLCAVSTEVRINISASNTVNRLELTLPHAPLNDEPAGYGSYVISNSDTSDNVRVWLGSGPRIVALRPNNAYFPAGILIFRLSAIYEIAAPGTGDETPVPDADPITATPTGPAGGDLEGDYPNPTVKASVVTSKSISQLQPPTVNLPMNGKKTTGQAKGTSANDGATVQNILDAMDALGTSSSTGITVSSTEPDNPGVNHLWIRPLS